MEKEVPQRYFLILSAEESFARAVALGVWVRRPLTAWHYLLPGMFLFDLIQRSSAIKKYSALYLFPRKLALDVGLDTAKGQDRSARLSRASEEIKGWLSALNLYTERLQKGHLEELQILTDHYFRLLQAESDRYPNLVREIYPTPDSYEEHLRRLAAAEKEIDQAIAEIHGNSKEIWEKLRMEQVQVEELREKELRKIFPGRK